MLNRELAKLWIWFEQIITELVKNQLYVIFRNHLPNVDINLCINNERVTRIHVTKFLGVFIDDDLNWKHHINMVRSKLSKVAAIMYKASCLINQDGMYILYCSLFLSYTSYCSGIWGSTYAANIYFIMVLQKRVVRQVCGAKHLGHF